MNIQETLQCWKATRINGASASIACDYLDVDIALLHAFDEVAELTREFYLEKKSDTDPHV